MKPSYAYISQKRIKWLRTQTYRKRCRKADQCGRVVLDHFNNVVTSSNPAGGILCRSLCVLLSSLPLCAKGHFTSTDPAQMTKRFTVSAELE